MVIDPICCLTVDESTERRAHFNGVTFYFCSEHCREKFSSAAESEKHKLFHRQPGAHTCAKHPELWQEDPCECPKCRMAVAPAAKYPSMGAHGKSKSLKLAVRFRIAAAKVLPIVRAWHSITIGHLSRFIRPPGQSTMKSRTRFPRITQSAR